MKFTFKSKLPKTGGYSKVAFSESSDTELLGKGKNREICLGLGKASDLDNRKLRMAVRKLIREAKGAKLKRLAIKAKDLIGLGLDLLETEVAELFVLEADLASYEFRKYKKTPKGGWNDVEEVAFVGKVSEEFKGGVERGKVIAEGSLGVREMSNVPGVDMSPEEMAKTAKDLTKGNKITVKVLSVKDMEKLGMGGVLTVGKGSELPPRFIVMEYMGGEKSERPIVLVGKGITFDTGGYSLKVPYANMHGMHMDMTGGAAVINTVATVARLGLKRNVVGLVASAENMVSHNAMRTNDIIRSYSGLTVEVLNTDAEGRLVLMDGLYYAGKHYKPILVVDIATLTGASMMALGLNYAAAIFTRDEDLMNLTMDLGEETGEYVWPLPLWEEYESEIKGKMSDLKNMGEGRWGGAITAAAFLLQFTKEYPKDCSYMHIDMASMDVNLREIGLAPGSPGWGVRLLTKLVEEY